ncbi:MAG: cytochrome c biogenesis protein CcsA [Ferruginibacter sp.]|nr:cytochrome c biogenesis protein CcsA [Ferruginibacter sp.]
MEFVGEHLFIGKLGHFFVLLAFVASIISTISYFTAAKKTDLLEKTSWLKFSRLAFIAQLFSLIAVFVIIYTICANHYFEYMYAYKHASKELEPKYLLACIWEGQEGSFLLWTLWHSILGIILMFKAKEWEAPMMTVISFAQFWMLLMMLGIYVFDTRIGSSLFTLTRNEINGPIFSQPNYLSLIKDGVGLNVLLRNYWMVIHPPILFLGFATTIIPFAYAYAGLQTKRFGDWVKPALPWALVSACILGVGIMMGGKWAYESLSFGGYWAWDPVENASLVPWLILIAGLHTMVIYKATGHSLKASYIFIFLAFAFVLYSTYLTKSGDLGDSSVHSFTEPEKIFKWMLRGLVFSFTFPPLIYFLINNKNIKQEIKEERLDSREFWMFIGALVFFLSGIFIIAKTSIPVYNKLFGLKLAQPEDVEFSYNKVMIMVAIIVGILTAITQYFKYKQTPSSYTIKKIALPTFIAAVITASLAIFYPFTYHKQGAGFLAAIYIASFAGIYAVVANAAYIFSGLKGKLKVAGGSVAHIGFALMLVGMLISSSNKQVISSSRVNGINLPMGKDAMTKQQDNPLENLTLLRQVPTRLGDYEVTYQKDSLGHEKNRRFYKMLFVKKDANNKVIEEFTLQPDVYLMKDNNMSSNPDTKPYLTKDVFTYISYTLNKNENDDTTQFKITELAEGDTAYYSNGYMVLNSVIKNPHTDKYHTPKGDIALMADITLYSKDSMRYKAQPVIHVDAINATPIDDTVYAQNLFVRFAGVADKQKIKLGIKESDKPIDFVTLKAYIFPYINLVWLGLVVMAIGFTISAVNRAKLKPIFAAIALILVGLFMAYMFFVANN